MKSIYEEGRDVVVARETDVLVCGGGPAGIAVGPGSRIDSAGSIAEIVELICCVQLRKWR